MLVFFFIKTSLGGLVGPKTLLSVLGLRDPQTSLCVTDSACASLKQNIFIKEYFVYIYVYIYLYLCITIFIILVTIIDFKTTNQEVESCQYLVKTNPTPFFILGKSL